MGVHTSVNAGKVLVVGDVGALSCWCKLQLDRHSGDEKALALGPQKESLPPFPAPDLYLYREGANIIQNPGLLIKQPEGNYTAATGQSSQPLRNTG